jgi:hypothetical protein
MSAKSMVWKMVSMWIAVGRRRPTGAKIELAKAWMLSG